MTRPADLIRLVDGHHTLGVSALADALIDPGEVTVAPPPGAAARCNDPQCARRGVVAALREVKRRVFGGREQWRTAVDDVMREHGAVDVDRGTGAPALPEPEPPAGN